MRQDLRFFLLSWPVLTCLIVVLLFFLLVEQLSPEVNVLQLREVSFFSAAEVEKPDALAGVPRQRVLLPHNWNRHGFAGRDAWYQAQLRLNVPPNRLWGLYLPSVGSNAAIYLNGHFLGSGGRMTDPPARNGFRPLYFAIPNGMLKPEVNEIVVHVTTDPAGRGFLGPLLMGPDKTLNPVYQRSYFIRVTLVQFIAVSLLVSMFYVGALALKTNDPVYGYFAALLGACLLFDGSLLFPASPLPGRWMDWLRMLGSGWLSVFLVLFLHRFLMLNRPRIDRYVLLWGGTGSLLLAFLPTSWLYQVSGYYWDVFTMIWGSYALVTAFVATRQSYSRECWALTLSILVMLGAGLRDWIVYTENPERYHGTLLIYAVLYPMVIFGWVLLHRFTSALSEAATLNRELEERIARRETELAVNYERINEAQQQQALAEERERIMRDMHDGIGGQLISAINVARKDARVELADALETALADLRLMIDSFEPLDEDLGTVLGLIRMRLEKRIHNHNLKFVWRVEDLPRVPGLGPHKVLHVMRIIEEAVTNVVRHARASHIVVAARTREREGRMGVIVEIIDDGKGIDPQAERGCGLINMHSRANRISAVLDVKTNSGGTAIQLWMPVSVP